mmetsp:Transcript_11783/g.12837  ORF Transcript_11783/g.12837 Transcript_11783/m.12837 type:complete len:101 (+) Transcript_11783:223-525(+)
MMVMILFQVLPLIYSIQVPLLFVGTCHRLGRALLLHPLLLLLVHYASFKYHTPEFDTTKDLDVGDTPAITDTDDDTFHVQQFCFCWNIIFERSDYYLREI